jgi:hypothetical protein
MRTSPKKTKPLSPQEEVEIAVLRKFARAHSKAGRQWLRRDQFKVSFREVTAKFGGESRMRRRRIAKAIMKRFWKSRAETPAGAPTNTP